VPLAAFLVFSYAILRGIPRGRHSFTLLCVNRDCPSAAPSAAPEVKAYRVAYGFIGVAVAMMLGLLIVLR
jgi:hypothetical protein